MTDYPKALAALREARTKFNAEVARVAGPQTLQHRAEELSARVLDFLDALEAARGEAVAWVPVVGFEGIYEVSSAGLVRRIDSGKVLSTAAKAGDGYVKCDLYKSGARTQTYLHRVVCEAFHGPADGRQVNHKDGDKENNAASNLEWVSSSENVNHSYYVLGNNVSPVEAYDHSHGREALSFESVEQAVRSGFDSAHIYRCINNANKRHGGYRWRFTKAAPPAALAEPLFLLHTGAVYGNERDDWEIEANSDAAVDAYCDANPGKTIGLYLAAPAQHPAAAVPEGGLRDSVLNSAKFRASCYALVGIVEGIEGLGRNWAANGERLKDTREWVAFYNCVASMRNGTFDPASAEQAQPAAAGVPDANVTPMRQPRADLARLVESINAAVYANGDGLSVTEAIGALELAKLELLKEQEQ